MEFKLVGLLISLFVTSVFAQSGTPGYYCNADAQVINPDTDGLVSNGIWQLTTGAQNAVVGNTAAASNFIVAPCDSYSDTNPAKLFWLKWTPASDVDAIVQVTANNSTATWNTRLSIFSQKGTDKICGQTGFNVNNQWTCESRVLDMCNSYPTTPEPEQFKAGRVYYILLDSDSSSATYFYIRLTHVVPSFVEDFEAGELPVGWNVYGSGAPRSWHVGNISDNDHAPEWTISAINAAPVGGIGNYILALDPLRNDPISYASCGSAAEQFKQNCNHDNDTVTTSAYAVPNEKAFLSFSTYFFNGLQPPTDNQADANATVYISKDNGVTWTLIDVMDSFFLARWYYKNIDITAYAGETVKFAFRFQTIYYPPKHGWLIDQVQIIPVGDFDMCEDGYGCTEHTCDSSSTGCDTDVNTTYCGTIVSDCYSNQCDPTTSTEASGCVFAPIPDYCDDGISCTTDICNQTTGCHHETDDSKCDDGKGCTTNQCLGNATLADSNGCYFVQECNDDVTCTIDTCVNNTIGEDKCLHTVDFTICEDFIDCTYELTCDAENPGFALDAPGCIRIPMHEWCDDQDPCTIDTCEPELNSTNSCVHRNVTCDDCLDCTMDFCDNGQCYNEPQDYACDDQFDCTVDVCDPSLGKCTNTPNDTYCGFYGDLCHTHFCRPWAASDASGCVSIPIECDDDIACSDDSCDEFTGACVFTANDTRCDDTLEATDDSCSLSLGKCVNTPNSENCDDGLNCTIDYADMTGHCQVMDVDCTDDIHCTVDYCDEDLGCVNLANDTNCDDGWDCTVDTCDTSLGRCNNLPSDSYCTMIGDPCFIHFCNPESSSDVSGCYSVEKNCDDGLTCTYDWCNSTTGECQHDAINERCDDGFECTNDVCDTVMGRCTNYANDSACDDQNACTVDVCGADGQCHWIEQVCNDQIYCTVDYCDEISGQCHSDANDTLCDDGISCTRDYCDTEIGRCVNIPFDIDCPATSECTEGVCSLEAGGCVFKNHNEWCDDWIGCTVDVCLGEFGCSNEVHDSLCDDGIGCTQDACNVTLGGCQYSERDDWCADANEGPDCTENICSPTEDCVIVLHNDVCDDSVNCTLDYCSADGCHNDAQNLWCSDGHGCTEDVCNPFGDSEDKCEHIQHHDLCEDGFSCSTHTCDLDFGCMVNFTDCPWSGLGPDDSTCINCVSGRSSIEVDSYTDGSGAMKFSTMNSESGALGTNMVLLPTSAVLIGASGQDELAVAANDGLVVKDPFRIVPISDANKPTCNEVKRGTIIVLEVNDVPCGPTFCTRDQPYICVKAQDYEWVPLGDNL